MDVVYYVALFSLTIISMLGGAMFWLGRKFAQIDERFKQIDERFRQVDERFQRLEKGLEEVKGRLTNVEKRLEEVKAQLAEFKSWTEKKFTETEGGLANVEGRVAGLEGRLTEVEKGLADVRGRLAGVEGRLVEFEERFVSFADAVAKEIARERGVKALVKRWGADLEKAVEDPDYLWDKYPETEVLINDLVEANLIVEVWERDPRAWIDQPPPERDPDLGIGRYFAWQTPLHREAVKKALESVRGGLSI